MDRTVRIGQVAAQDGWRREDCRQLTPDARVAVLLAFRSAYFGARVQPLARQARLVRPAKLRLRPPRAPGGLEAGISASRRWVTEDPPSRRSRLARELASAVRMLPHQARLGCAPHA